MTYPMKVNAQLHEGALEVAVQSEEDSNDVLIGKDILELVGSAMYVNPLAVYREYIQNAADAIDEAKQLGLLPDDEPGKVHIITDIENRSVKIRDNGSGVSNRRFKRRLKAFGASKKRGTNARGFRGVGRFSGLGFCQELVFRSRAAGDKKVLEIRWDGRKFKELLADINYDADLKTFVNEITEVRELPDKEFPPHFFEVELVKPVRISNDVLLNELVVHDYLAEVAPVPFSPEFTFGERIRNRLREHVQLGEIEVFIGKDMQPIYRPFRDEFEYAEGRLDQFHELEFRIINSMNGEVAAIVWMLHHGYHGAIPNSQGIKGLRARVGNMQVGDHMLFTDIFLEDRFNSWTVGEIHIIDPKVIPNGRRDSFGQNKHFSNLLNHLSPVASYISKMCRDSSVIRNRIKEFETGEKKIEERLEVLEQGALDKQEAKKYEEEVRSTLFEMKKMAEAEKLPVEHKKALSLRLKGIKKRISDFNGDSNGADPLDHLPVNERKVYRRVIGLIYQHSANKVAAKSLVDRILAQLGG